MSYKTVSVILDVLNSCIAASRTSSPTSAVPQHSMLAGEAGCFRSEGGCALRLSAAAGLLQRRRCPAQTALSSGYPPTCPR